MVHLVKLIISLSILCPCLFFGGKTCFGGKLVAVSLFIFFGGKLVDVKDFGGKKSFGGKLMVVSDFGGNIFLVGKRQWQVRINRRFHFMKPQLLINHYPIYVQVISK